MDRRAREQSPGCVEAIWLVGGGIVVCVLLGVVTGARWPLFVAVPLHVLACVFYARAVEHRIQRGKWWPCWALGTLLGLLLAWALPGSRLALLVLAGAEAVVTVGMCWWWYVNLEAGRGGWLVLDEDQDVLLRRESTGEAADRWVESYLLHPHFRGERLTVMPARDIPEYRGQAPRYPHADRPFQALPPT